jgi:hypothetical protein
MGNNGMVYGASKWSLWYNDINLDWWEDYAEGKGEGCTGRGVNFRLGLRMALAILEQFYFLYHTSALL